MLRHHVNLLRLIALGSEVAVAVLAVALATATRFGPSGPGIGATNIPWIVFATVYALGWGAAVWLSDLHRLRARWTLRSELADLTRAFVMLQLVLFATLFLARLPELSRLFLLELVVVHGILAVVHRLTLRVVVAWLPEQTRGLREIIVAGTGSDAVAFARQLRRHPELGLRIAGYLEGSGRAEGASRVHILGTLEDAVRVFGAHVVDELVICLDAADAGYIEPLVQLAHEQGKVVRVWVGDGPPPAIPGGRLETLDEMRVLSVLPTNERTVGLAVKRLLDLVLAVVALVLLAPAFALITIALLLTGGRPVLFRQARVGLQGRPFQVIKFRTMVTDAEARLGDLEALNEVRGHAFKLTRDPRVTRVGRILRRTSLDELPQLLNVLRGEMSLVGPRPPLRGEVAGYDLWHRRRLSMKPGITGLWQVSARLEAEFDRWVELDLRYIDRWSLWLDLKIMLRTVPAMLSGR
jgi:exopolysaccharide biosynthesis polyprenyl glycosylphosphotransferase